MQAATSKAPAKTKARAQHKTAPMHSPERLAYNVNDACAALSISRTSLYAMVASGELKVIKIAGRTVVPRHELERVTRIQADPS